jgi:TrmH family RNA methyltransferase
VITSTSNPRIKAIRRLAKRRERAAERLFLIEGRRELDRAVAAGVEIEVVVSAGDVAAPPGAEVLEVSRSVLDALVYREGGDAVVAVARMFDTSLGALRLPPDPLVLVAAGIEKPGNLGAMLRTAAAAGVDALVVADPVTDVFNPNVVRASVGALFTVPTVVGEAPAVVAALDGLRVPHWAADMTRGTAIVIGSEAGGLPTEWLEAAHERIVVPMPGARGVDSLNASSTAAVVLFEAVRQRSS